MSLHQQAEQAGHGGSARPAWVVGALGIVFGDIGTSPLYTVRAALGRFETLTPDLVLGVLSLLFWMLIWVVSIKYVLLMLRADNRGEGGTLALMELASQARARADAGSGTSPARASRRRQCLIVLGLAGACLFYGDTVITPAISVLSAVEGLAILSPDLKHWVVPVAAGFILALFSIQRRGTGSIGRWFGPLMLIWFVLIGGLGAWRIIEHPQVLWALDPRFALSFIQHAPWQVYLLLGALVLALTGAETLYADMGHFGRRTISRAWFLVALPGLACCYLGQGALLLSSPQAIVNPFFFLAPQWGTLPLVVFATIASIIASQAVISGAFSVTRQAIQLGFWPRMIIQHTSAQAEGQVYLPRINQWLCVAVLALVIGFGSSEALTHAYGFAVTGTMLVTTLLATQVLPARVPPRWRKAVWLGLALFLAFDIVLFSANFSKFFDGGWLPTIIGASLLTLMMTWRNGQAQVHALLSENQPVLKDFMQGLEEYPPARVGGTAIYMSPYANAVPAALLHNLKHNKVLHEQTFFLTVYSAGQPYVASQNRYELERLSSSSWRVSAHWGFKQEPDVPQLLSQMAHEHPELLLEPMSTSFFLSRHTLIALRKLPWYARWRRALYAFMARNASGSSRFYKIAPNRVVEMGMQLEL
ncbi:potassium transporter Kup [Pusillimonas sp. CC-YST705]|uniref:Probable potassium transport system protein Kup n=1 Tax=Mesopusillimonas faecipullorum TaxID=2755040 RepID=A0ABS8CD70_9BURK|nr:potassium transporter Kup [Mesopusillimonas faecipullorum]MCB5363971.1 potassium transporter Kup [Mesopusillimonas faecipullorum]